MFLAVHRRYEYELMVRQVGARLCGEEAVVHVKWSTW